jgi:hypothetical protein
LNRKRLFGREIFDTSRCFVLDTGIFSSIIYILYAGGVLSPPVGTPRHRTYQLSCQISPGGRMAKKTAKGGKKKGGKKR